MSFKQLHQTSLVVTNVALCPTMDLVAYSTDDGQLVIHRTMAESSQRVVATSQAAPSPAPAPATTATATATSTTTSTSIAATTPDAKAAANLITSLCWTPSGRSVVCGHGDGALTIRDCQEGRCGWLGG